MRSWPAVGTAVLSTKKDLLQQGHDKLHQLYTQLHQLLKYKFREPASRATGMAGTA
jgi:hypothetical protein